MVSATRTAPPGEPWWLHPWVLGAVVLSVMLAALLMVGRQQPLLAVAVMTAAVGVLVIIGSPDLLIPIAVFMLYTNAAVIAVHFHGAPLAFGLTPLLLLAVPAVRDVVLRGQKLVVTPPLAFFFCFFVIQVVGALSAMKPRESVEGLITWVVEGLVLYLLEFVAQFAPEGVGREVIRYVAIAPHFEPALRGEFRSEDVAYYVIFVVFMLSLVRLTVESFRWR